MYEIKNIKHVRLVVELRLTVYTKDQGLLGEGGCPPWGIFLSDPRTIYKRERRKPGTSCLPVREQNPSGTSRVGLCWSVGWMDVGLSPIVHLWDLGL